MREKPLSDNKFPIAAKVYVRHVSLLCCKEYSKFRYDHAFKYLSHIEKSKIHSEII